MGIFDRFPYSSTHEMNLDFMLGKATEIAEDMQQVTAGMAQVQAGLSAISEKTEQATQAAAQAAQSASSIEGSVTAAEEAAEEAQMHNESAQTWANNAMTYKADCQRSATEAAASSASAAQAATAAAGSEDTVAQYAQAANASAQSAANNNDSAHQYANQASASASNATFHSSNAQTAATNAQTAATNANTSATNASASADRAASLKTDVETLHRMCTAAVDQAATEAVNAANSAAQAAATKTDVETLVESLPEDFTDLNNTVNQLSDEIVPIKEKFSERNPHNLLYGVALTEGKRWMANASAPASASGYFLTDFIPVEQGKLYALVSDVRKGNNGGIGSMVYYAQFDASKNIILQDNDGRQATITPGENTAFFRISYLNDNINPIFTYAPFTGDILDPVQEIVDTYKAVTADEIIFQGKNTQYVNLLESHKDSIVKNKYLTNGLLANHNNWMSLADYIPCKPSTNYNLAVKTVLSYNPSCKIAWYTADGTFISDVSHANNTPFLSPENAYYLRITVIQKTETQPTAEEDFANYYLAETETPYGPPCVNPYPVFTGIYPASSLYGKKWFAFGDSITEKNIRSTINYHDYIRQETGIDVFNKGVGGSGYKCRWQNGNCMYQLAETASTELATADVVTCMAGINDSWSDLTNNMGDATDVFDTSATAQNQSVMACFNHFLDVIIASAPYAKIGIISPLPCYHTSGNTLYDFKPDNDASVLAVFIEKCKTACKNKGIPYLDLFHTSGLRPWDANFNTAMFKCNSTDSPDGLHPNYLGHKFFYPLVREFVKTLI